MPSEQKMTYEKISSNQVENSHNWIDYWNQFSSFNTWQFWVTVLLLLVPLIVLYFTIDRKKALLLGFYGFNVHVWFTYIDLPGVIFGFWGYPYRAIPFFPYSFSLDVALVPVIYMLVFQWVIKNNKNYYFYFTLLSLFFAFILKPLMVTLGLFEFSRGANYFYLFIGYMAIMLVSKWITNLFIWFEKNRSTTIN
ncbi:CBO0543 family protein [Bacillus litorisediminis]|uniref:CBO0543 family protein n=1 Tax=Bacillus litorisediminis TaxID=2922713 RepID=UPI001FAF7699|nr:CBO0543 family protein [Bacillus litorisediminis]